jgi:hypothetical protein
MALKIYLHHLQVCELMFRYLHCWLDRARGSEIVSIFTATNDDNRSQLF